MKDYKLMYYHMRGQMEMSAEILGMSNDMLKTSYKSINEIADTHIKAIKDITHIIDMATLRFDIIKEKMENAHLNTEALFEEDEE